MAKIHHASVTFLYNTENYGLPCSCQTYDPPFTGSQSICQGIYCWCHHRVSVGVSWHLAKNASEHLCGYIPQSCSKTVSATRGKIGLVNEWPIPFLFPLPECWQSNQVALQKWRNTRNNGEQESWAIEAVCRRLGYAGLKPDHEKAVRSFGNSRDVLRACQPWMHSLNASKIAPVSLSLKEVFLSRIVIPWWSESPGKIIFATVVPHIIWGHIPTNVTSQFLQPQRMKTE